MLPSLSGGKGPNVSIDKFFHWDTRGDRERFPMAYMEVCDNLWQEGQETEVPTSCLNSLADCQQRVPVCPEF
jgi:hypothetical protein